VSDLSRLIALFANNSIQAIRDDPSLLVTAFDDELQTTERTIDVLMNRHQFPELRELVERLKRIIERMEEDPEFIKADPKAQVSRSLRALFRFVRFENVPDITLEFRAKALRDLLLGHYGADVTWSPAQRKHFDFVFERLMAWKTYFLSYTNHGGSVVNSTFKEVVDLHTEPEILSARERTRHNILADAIVNSLRKRVGKRGGFFDKSDIKVADDLDDKISPAATRTFAFVQLVHLETFDTTQDVNWSWKEYSLFDNYNELELQGREEYRQVLSSRFAPLLTMSKAEFKKQLPEVSWDYDLWYERIFDQAKFLQLPVTAASFADAMGELSDGIVNLTYKIIDNVPA
jgi:hypothetical protein